MMRMKIACITINSLDNYAGIPKWRYSLPFAYLQSYYTLSKFHSRTQFVDIVKDVNADEPELLDAIEKESPDVAAFSCYVWNTQKVCRLLPKIRKRLRQTRIVVGGPECTPDFMGLLEPGSYFDVLVKGEGETVFRQLIDTLHETGGIAHDIPGTICYAKAARRFIENPDAQPLRDINAIPSPYLNGIIDVKGLASSVIGIETQRGCAYHCGYCSYPKGAKAIRYFDMQRILRELDLILAAGPRQLYLMDPMFNSDRNRAGQILRHIGKKNTAPKTVINTEILIDTMDETLFALARKAGVKTIEVGIQSFNPVAIKNLHRHRNEKKLLANMRTGLKYGLNLIPQIIYGLPGDTLGDFFDSFDRMYAFKVKELDLFRLLILPGTEFRKKALLYGMTYDAAPPYEIRSNGQLSVKEADYLDLFRKVVLCTVWYKEVIMQICRKAHLPYHQLFNGFVAARRRSLENTIFDWPIHSKEDKDSAMRIVRRFSDYLGKTAGRSKGTYEPIRRKIAQAEAYTKKVLLFRYLSVRSTRPV